MSEGQGSENFTTLPAIWPNVDELPVLQANSFLVQLGLIAPDGSLDPATFIVGQVNMPAILGTPDEQQAMMRAVGAIPVRALGRYSMTRARLAELRDVLTDVLSKIDEAAAQAADAHRAAGGAPS